MAILLGNTIYGLSSVAQKRPVGSDWNFDHWVAPGVIVCKIMFLYFYVFRWESSLFIPWPRQSFFFVAVALTNNWLYQGVPFSWEPSLSICCFVFDDNMFLTLMASFVCPCYPRTSPRQQLILVELRSWHVQVDEEDFAQIYQSEHSS